MKNKHQRGKSGEPRHIRLYYWMMQSEAWKDLNAVERAVYVDLSFYYNGSNNGRIGYSARTAARNLKIGKSTAARALRSLQEHGFIVVEQIGAFHCKVRHASEYRLTVYDSDIATNYPDTLATKECMRWSKNSKLGPCSGTYGPTGGQIRPPSGTVSEKKTHHGTRSGTMNARFAKSRSL